MGIYALEWRAHLQERDGHAKSDTGTPQRSLVLLNRPGVALKALEDVGQLELALLDLHEELGSGWHGHGLAGSRGCAVGGVETEHVGDLLGLVLLGSTEDVGFGAIGVRKLVHHGLGSAGVSLGYMAGSGSAMKTRLRTMVPYVINPTSALGGKRLSETTKVSFNAFNSSSSTHVSTT
jgi:hypothetical protein